jgi:hypothetical protein
LKSTRVEKLGFLTACFRRISSFSSFARRLNDGYSSVSRFTRTSPAFCTPPITSLPHPDFTRSSKSTRVKKLGFPACFCGISSFSSSARRLNDGYSVSRNSAAPTPAFCTRPIRFLSSPPLHKELEEHKSRETRVWWIDCVQAWRHLIWFRHLSRSWRSRH